MRGFIEELLEQVLKAAFGMHQAGDQQIDLVAPRQPLTGNTVEAGTHAVEL